MTISSQEVPTQFSWQIDNVSRLDPIGEIGEGILPFADANIAAAPIPPQTVDELEELQSTVYELTVTKAAKLGIPVLGDVGGGSSRRIIVMEWTRFKAIEHTDGLIYRYGYAIRFCLTVNRWDATMKLSLPFLSAQAELGNLQAAWQMQVRGLVGPKIDAAALPPKQLSVETFVIATQSMSALIAAIQDPSTRFIAGVLLAKSDPLGIDSRFRLAVLESYALSAISRGRVLTQAQGEAPVQPDELDIVRAVYDDLGASVTDKPSEQVRTTAQRILGGFRTDG